MESARQIPKREGGLWRYALAPVALLLLICGFYCEEDWRGHHSWNRLKRQLEANGGHLDWTNYVPTPVPDNENFFGDASMRRWFTGRGGNDFTLRLDQGRNSFLEEHQGDILAAVTVVSRSNKVAAGNADVTLVYDSALSTLGFETEATSNIRSNEVIPLIVMDEVPLDQAIKALAHNAGLNYMVHLERKRRPLDETWESGRWEDLRAREVLGAMLKKNDLQFMPDSKTGIGQIIAKEPGNGGIAIEPGITNRVKDLLLLAINAATNGLHGKCAYNAMGVMLTAEEMSPVKPLRIVVRSDGDLTANDLTTVFPTLKNDRYPNLTCGAQVEPAGSNSFVVRLKPILRVGAADYLKWSDGLAKDFDSIREALKRPYAQMTGNYTDPINMPIPNFICQRIVAQTLTDRAKCHLLLGQPEAALDDLALVRGLCRIMEGGPSGRPMTLVATMINSAVTALYAETIAEGMRLNAWREPQLAALQEQLKQINLPPLLAESFQCERASVCKTLEGVTAERLENIFKGGPGNTAKPLWAKMKDPTYLLLTVGPRGWVYQNLTRIALLDDQVLKGLDTKNRLVSSALTEKATSNTLAELGHFSPYTYLAAIAVPNFASAVRWLARSQCLTDEALIACALERYRLVHGEYPQTLGALTPQFLDKISPDIITGKPLKYRVKEDGQFLLYSVGWNEKDDGGVPGATKWGIPDPAQGDWVWGIRPQ